MEAAATQNVLSHAWLSIYRLPNMVNNEFDLMPMICILYPNNNTPGNHIIIIVTVTLPPFRWLNKNKNNNEK